MYVIEIGGILLQKYLLGGRMKKNKNEVKSPLRHELLDLKRKGVGLYLDGKNYRTERISRIVAESNDYMRDYILEGGEIKAIDFRKLSDEDRRR